MTLAFDGERNAARVSAPSENLTVSGVSAVNTGRLWAELYALFWSLRVLQGVSGLEARDAL